MTCYPSGHRYQCAALPKKVWGIFLSLFHENASSYLLSDTKSFPLTTKFNSKLIMFEDLF